MNWLRYARSIAIKFFRVFVKLRRALLLLAAGAFSTAELAARLAIDFLAEDSCVICKMGPELCKPSQDREEGGDGAHLLIDRVVKVRFLFFTLYNHPICPDCAQGFDPARGMGLLGYALPDNSVITVSGERFFEPENGKGSCDRGDLSPGQSGAGEAIGIIAPWMTNDNVLCIVHLIKYKSYLDLVPLVASTVAGAFTMFSHPILPRSVLVPVPSHRDDLKKRGFNLAAVLSSALSKEMAIPVELDALEKIRATNRQSKTQSNARAANVRFAFSARGVQGRNVFLVDDLLTTGSTAASCAAALLGAGAESSTVLCFGRAI